MGLANKYDKSIEDVMTLFEDNSCSYKMLENALQGKTDDHQNVWSSPEEIDNPFYYS